MCQLWLQTCKRLFLRSGCLEFKLILLEQNPSYFCSSERVIEIHRSHKRISLLKNTSLVTKTPKTKRNKTKPRKSCFRKQGKTTKP